VATASAAVKRVESALGVEVVRENYTAPPAFRVRGERLIYRKCTAALSMLDQAKQTIFTDSGEVSGEIRIAVSSDLGRNIAIPWIDDFMALHPHVTLRVHIK